jgi:hypothetical protein
MNNGPLCSIVDHQDERRPRREFSLRSVVFRVARRSTNAHVQLVRRTVCGDDVERTMGRAAQQTVQAMNGV